MFSLIRNPARKLIRRFRRRAVRTLRRFCEIQRALRVCRHDGREFRRPQDVGGAAFEIPPYRARFQRGAAQESEAFQLYRQRDQIYGGVVRVFVADGQRLVLGLV